MRWSSFLSAALLFPLLSMVHAQTQTITSLETGVFATTSGGSLISLPTTITYILTITGAANQTQSSNNTSTGSQSGSSQNKTASATPTKTITATAATDIPVGGGPSNADAPLPGESHNDIYGPNDNYVAAAPKLVGVISSVGVAVIAGVGGWLVLV